jgi:hypothetical protein
LLNLPEGNVTSPFRGILVSGDEVTCVLLRGGSVLMLCISYDSAWRCWFQPSE